MYTNDTCYMYMCITGYYGNVTVLTNAKLNEPGLLFCLCCFYYANINGWHRSRSLRQSTQQVHVPAQLRRIEIVA